MRWPSSPCHGISSSPGSSFWNLTQKTFRPLLFVADGLEEAVCPQVSAMAGLYHLPLGVDGKLQPCMRGAQRALDNRRALTTREDEAEITRAFRQRNKPPVDLCGD